LDEYGAINQQNFNEISMVLSQQQSSLQKEISLLKSAEGDFSGIIEEAVKSIVSVATDKAMGSGFFVNSEGYIITNYHVVEDGDIINVLTYENEIVPASMVGFDDVKDLALLKVSGDYEIIELGDSDDLQVGNKVIAIGNPLGLSFSVTEGIISALEREGPSGVDEYIQTDVSLNPGNSGGPLVDIEGRAVGVNNFKIGGAESLGFALEINSVKEFINEASNETII